MSAYVYSSLILKIKEDFTIYIWIYEEIFTTLHRKTSVTW